MLVYFPPNFHQFFLFSHFLQSSHSVMSKSVDDTKKREDPSKLKIGFFGVGIMGSAIVKNLARAGYKMHVWTRTKEKVRKEISRINMLKFLFYSLSLSY